MMGALTAVLHLARSWPYRTSCVMATIVSGALAFFLAYSELDSKRAAERASWRDRTETKTKLKERKALEQELAEVRTVTERIENSLVDEANLAENLMHFYSIEEETKARLPELHQVSSPTTDKATHYRRIPYGLRVAGTYDQVLAFLRALETGKRLAKVTSFNLARTDPDGRTVALDLSVELLGKK